MINLKPTTTSAFFAIALLAACATPYEQCVSQANSDLRQTEREILHFRTNVNRGYAVHRQSIPYTVARECVDEHEQTYRCDEVRYYTEETPVSIDIAAEQHKLERASARLSNLREDAEQMTRSCQVQYPDG